MELTPITRGALVCTRERWGVLGFYEGKEQQELEVRKLFLLGVQNKNRLLLHRLGT